MLISHQIPSIAVGIPTFRREQVLIDTLTQLLALPHPADEIIVADQTPEHEPHVEAYLSQKQAENQIRWIRLEKPNVCGARNQVLANTSCDFVLFFDDDVLIPPDIVKRHRQSYLEHPEYDALGGEVYQRNCDPKDLSLECPTVGTIKNSAIYTKMLVDIYFGGNFSVHRQTAIDAGGFDEQFLGSANWEEGDFAARLKRAGYVMCFDPSIWVIHLRHPIGGCRIPGNCFHPQWTKTMNYFLYRFRYGRQGKATWARTLKESLRSGPLLRENFFRPWRWHYYWANYFYSIFEGYKRAKSPIQSPFMN